MLDPELEMEVDDLARMSTNNGPVESEVVDIYAWIDSLNFSRPKKNITRDFSDGVLMAELIHHYVPKIIDIRNYYQALSKKNKENNWNHLNMKVLSKLGIRIDKPRLNDVMENKPGAIEKVSELIPTFNPILYDLRPFLARRNRTILNYRREVGRSSSSNAAPVSTVKKIESQNQNRAVSKVPPKKPQRSTSISAAPKRPAFSKPPPKAVAVTRQPEKLKEKKATVVQKQQVAKSRESLAKQPIAKSREALAKQPVAKSREALAKQPVPKAPESLAKQLITKAAESLAKHPSVAQASDSLVKQNDSKKLPISLPLPNEEESLETIPEEVHNSSIRNSDVAGNNNEGKPGSMFPSDKLLRASSGDLKEDPGNIIIGGDFSANISPHFMSRMDEILFSEEDMLKSVNSLSWAGVGTHRTPTNLLSSAMRMHMSGLV